MIIRTAQTRVPLLEQASAIVTGRAIAATAPRGRRRVISNSVPKRYAVNMAGAEADASDDNKQNAGPAKEELPPLSDHEFKIYNRLAERMDWFVSRALMSMMHAHSP